MNDLHKVGGAGVHILTEFSPEVDIQVESCQEICRGAVGGPGTIKDHLHGVEVPDEARHRKVHGPDLANEEL